MGEVIRLQTIPEQGSAEDPGPVSQRHDGFRGNRIIMDPIFDVILRPEEVHAASAQAPGCFSPQDLGERDIHLPHGRRRIDLQNIFVFHADPDGFSAIQAPRVDTDLRFRKEPAHGQRFKSSLAVPLLFPGDGHQVVGRDIGKRCPRFDVICFVDKPAGDG